MLLTTVVNTAPCVSDVAPATCEGYFIYQACGARDVRILPRMLLHASHAKVFKALKLQKGNILLQHRHSNENFNDEHGPSYGEAPSAPSDIYAASLDETKLTFFSDTVLWKPSRIGGTFQSVLKSIQAFGKGNITATKLSRHI